MSKRKFLKMLWSILLSLTMVISLMGPSKIARAEEEETEDETTEEDTASNTKASTVADDSVEDVPLGQLVARWTFDENYNESVSGLKTNLGAKKLTYTNGIFGKAAVFNGKDNYLVVEPDAVLNLGNSRNTNNSKFTISAWINLGDSPEREKYLLDKGLNDGWDKNDGIYWTNPYRIYFNGCEPVVKLSNEFRDENTDPYFEVEGNSTTSGKYVEGGEWFLLTVTYDGKKVMIYHDNELLTQYNYTDGITFNNDELFIGVDCKLVNFFKGYVDDLRLYTGTLSYDEVEALYQEGLKANKEFVEPTKQLVAYYDFNDNLKDSSTFKNNAEKVAVGGTTKYVAGMCGKAITMSKGNYIRVPAGDQLNFDTEFTASFWLKLDKEGTYPVLCRQNPCYSDSDDNQSTYKVTADSWGGAESTAMAMVTNVYDPDSWTMVDGQYINTQYDYSETGFKATNWFHYTFTYQDGQMKSYLNGKLQEKTEMSDLINIANAAGDLLIGYDGSTFITGAIDELKIYNKCLSATDVAKEAKRFDSISLSADDADKVATVGKGKSVTISSILLKDGNTGKSSELALDNKNFTFKSSNTKIFTVTADGKITGVKAGKAKLTITYGPHTKTYTIKAE